MVRLLFNCHFWVPQLQSSAIWQKNLHLAQKRLSSLLFKKTHLHYLHVCNTNRWNTVSEFRPFQKLSKNLQFLGRLPCPLILQWLAYPEFCRAIVSWSSVWMRIYLSRWPNLLIGCLAGSDCWSYHHPRFRSAHRSDDTLVVVGC